MDIKETIKELENIKINSNCIRAYHEYLECSLCKDWQQKGCGRYLIEELLNKLKGLE